jgi:chlorite dismutase
MAPIIGPILAPVSRIDVVASQGAAASPPSDWQLRGITSHVRYATRTELTDLRASAKPAGGSVPRWAALIPIRKSPAWWDLAQDERRAIFEETSHHTAIGLGYVPAVARTLFHCRDLGEPFDFLTWFEYDPQNERAFDELVGLLRATQEWTFVDREIDIRLELTT